MSYNIVDDNAIKEENLCPSVFIVDKDDLLQAVARFYHATRLASIRNPDLYMVDGDSVSKIMEEVKQARENLFKVAGLIE